MKKRLSFRATILPKLHLVQAWRCAMGEKTLNRFEWAKAVLQVEGLSGAAKTIAAALAIQFANAETGQINPSQETLADYLKLHRDTIKRAMRELRNAGWLMAIGDGGRGKAPRLRLLTPRKIIAFRAKQGGVNHPAQAEKRGEDLQQKGGEIAPSHYKEEQSLEQRRRQIPTKRPSALDPHMETRFEGNATEGPRAIPKDKWDALNDWGEWLSNQGLPKLIELPLVQIAEKTGAIYFWLPSIKPPTTPEATAQAIFFFADLIDGEASRHAAQ
ncbi:helix-turn-helix domain-containing protein [Sulfitobacter sp. S190]|uniref:helix-turn-helix domain-containing protein n=1 Tax=Sulfitobacter sp. S190 TaxID=2867022 RepID=UPI0021A884CE|nr:helix-turn-helix domain-containing protein [Sulfitobacter sp. S190]UWR22636.1 helix-turn-helix domain-containing protein [Sulfitobacter sp. S190]